MALAISMMTGFPVGQNQRIKRIRNGKMVSGKKGITGKKKGGVKKKGTEAKNPKRRTEMEIVIEMRGDLVNTVPVMTVNFTSLISMKMPMVTIRIFQTNSTTNSSRNILKEIPMLAAINSRHRWALRQNLLQHPIKLSAMNKFLSLLRSRLRQVSFYLSQYFHLS